ncbi:methyltransferase domain-containing protein [Nakamurella sp. YIM 132087]|uniref:Methyltransferase domain-containing protein n=1 Tax=Nakamurella alba TaxID=2665158 RepID=A0A7K1FGH9_9ACTN|nr:methyltransferase domain-containing protein [Nakamurella alba]MTD13221.1 methyltransferase domain-containing protein [Nakamurella alba]
MTDTRRLSPRLLAIVDQLPLRPGLKVLEIGGGTGAAACAVARRVAPGGRVLMIDRSEKSLAIARRTGADVISDGLLEVRMAAVEEFVPEPADRPFELAFAIRVGVLDGRHPQAGTAALDRLRAAAAPGARLAVCGDGPLRWLDL